MIPEAYRCKLHVLEKRGKFSHSDCLGDLPAAPVYVFAE